MMVSFPTPYPGELWYSVICRCHIAMGSTSWAETVRSLYGRPRMPVGTLYPSQAIQQVAAQLPPGVLNLRECAMDHTLLPILLRFHPTSQKKQVLHSFMDGEDIQPKLLFTARAREREGPLKYCPMCREEDTASYGEPYWHREHQIPTIPLCPRHGCRLIAVEASNTRSRSDQFLYLGSLPCAEADFRTLPWERAYTKELERLLVMPYEKSPVPQADNVRRLLENGGFLASGCVRRVAFDRGKIYQALREFFGEGLVKDVFGTGLTGAHMLRLRKYQISAPLEYAMLAVLFGTDTSVFFTKKPVPLQVEQKMRAMANSGREYSKAAIARQLGIPADKLQDYAARFSIQPFWTQQGKEREDPRSFAYTAHFTAAEQARLAAYAESEGFENISKLLRFLALNVSK